MSFQRMADRSKNSVKWYYTWKLSIPIIFILVGLITMKDLKEKDEYRQQLDAYQHAGQYITKEEFGDKWPFRMINEGYVYSTGNSAIFRTSGGVKYQLNGVAKSKGYNLLKYIWKDDPDLPGAKINIGPFIDLAFKNPIEYTEMIKREEEKQRQRLKELGIYQ